MFYDPAIAGSWPVLCAELTARDWLASWAAREPALAAASSVEDLAMLTAAGSPPAQANGVLGAVVRIAARAGGDDADAVLVALHLLSRGLVTAAGRLEGLVPNALSHLVAEVTGHIRECPTSVVYDSYAIQLIRKAEHSVLAERFPHYRHGERTSEHPIDPLTLGALPADRLLVAADPSCQDPAADHPVDAVHLVLWAVAGGVISHQDIELLLEVAAGRGPRGAALQQVAARRKVCVRTVNRRTRRVEAALRSAITAYPARVA